MDSSNECEQGVRPEGDVARQAFTRLKEQLLTCSNAGALKPNESD